jgi:hypothetical protein
MNSAETLGLDACRALTTERGKPWVAAFTGKIGVNHSVAAHMRKDAQKREEQKERNRKSDDQHFLRLAGYGVKISSHA